MPRFMYVSFDGILGHLGYSQVFRVLEGLAQRGHPSTLVSLETKRDLKDLARLNRIAARAKEAGVSWVWHPYNEGGSAPAVLRNISSLSALATRAAISDHPTHLHARGYQAAGIVLGMQAVLRRPWIFDARGFWIDERLEEGRWFTNPVTLRVARHIERQLYASADAVVTLTKLHAEELSAIGLRDPTKRTVVIPTCADFDDFRPLEPSGGDRFQPSLKASHDRRALYGIIGSLNRAYLPEKTAALAARCLQLDPAAQLLVLTKQKGDWMKVLAGAGVDPQRVTCLSLPHEEMPRWMAQLTWCLMLLTPETRAKRAAMPTKLAELFASDVGVAFHGCNSEAARWVEQAGAGIVLKDTTAGSLDWAAQVMTSRIRRQNNSRLIAESHFSLKSGITKYEAIIKSIHERRAS